MSDQPKWKTDYPISRPEEHRTCRREFGKLVAGATVAMAGAALGRNALHGMKDSEPAQPLLAATPTELPVGGYKLLRYPSDHDPVILVHPEVGLYVAFSQSCTHLMCPVHYDHSTTQMVCPCHKGYFSAIDGRVLAGPPPRPLPQLHVEVKPDGIWISEPENYHASQKVETSIA